MYLPIYKSIFLMFISVLLFSCGANLKVYENAEPKFDLFDYFEGETRAWGMVRDFKGKQIRRFEVDITGTVQGNQLVLQEYFTYADGTKEERVWTIVRQGDNHYTGSADDVIGEARGETKGNALRWQYTLRINTENGEVDLKLDDWMFLQDEHRMFNVATMKKFGIPLGKITLFFEKQNPSES